MRLLESSFKGQGGMKPQAGAGRERIRLFSAQYSGCSCLSASLARVSEGRDPVCIAHFRSPSLYM